MLFLVAVWIQQARQGKARQGKARQGKARQGKARRFKHSSAFTHMAHDAVPVGRMLADTEGSAPKKNATLNTWYSKLFIRVRG